MTLRDRQLAGMGRDELVAHLGVAEMALHGKRVLVAGAAGQIGSRVVDRLRQVQGVRVVPTDVDPAGGPWGCERMDITSFDDVLRTVRFHEPDLIVNLAAAKLAPAGETNPWATLNISVNGLKNLLDVGVRVVHVSTCKAADPEVAYGAGKLAAEKLAIAYGQTVTRLYNVPEAGPSMLTIWQNQVARGETPLVATHCRRFTLTLREAVASVVWACAAEPGRYAANPGQPVRMDEYFRLAFPGVDAVAMRPRRGDRLAEPRHARCESIQQTADPAMSQIVSAHDPKEAT